MYGYIRVSTTRQDTENQKFEILKWADSRKRPVTDWVEETSSSRKGYKDRKLGTLLDNLEPGDTLIVSEISRLGRSLTEVMTILHKLMETGIWVYTCKENFQLDDSINSKVLAFAFSLAAEIERKMISSRTREALARLKSEGKKLVDQRAVCLGRSWMAENRKSGKCWSRESARHRLLGCLE